MKLLRWGLRGAEQPGLLDSNGVLRDLTGHVPDIAGEVLSPAGLDRLRTLDPDTLPLVPGTPRLGPPVGGTGKFVAIGLNYADHAAETGAAVPPEPVVFLKATSCIVGPNDDVEIPRGSVKTDWEVELGVVIGSTAKYVPLESALDHVAGYCVVNDVSERDFQMNRSGTWDKGKGHDGFGPVGPWLVTRDEVPEPQDLRLWLEVDGRRYQDGSTRTMVYGVAFLVHYLSQFMTLHPGDLICTGTPPGVGLGQKPPVFLKPGQTMRLSVEGLGVQTQRTVQA
ncbi:fumarylacetoacetate hydrolase family protein [Indioceanicola profundi]|uniref:fumarylacetoacetate hydrolase family protein n=1 Tax=Indioceanicola profundi TaxID=2220096 RepID=UPI000E6ADB33|nr:fumarylacetoacetate hydrolase family protein [Indioceanicola profundi]